MRYVGVDGCKAGWFAVMLRGDGDREVEVFADVSSLWKKHSSAAAILIDIPIGLREGGHEERKCDREARRVLGPPRASSVFPAPCRPAIHAGSYREASDINKRMTGRGLSLQTWSIARKICEVDELLLSERAARLRVREIHPEICFRAFAGHSMRHSKKRAEGRLERTRVLESIYSGTPGVLEHARSAYRCREVATDDILDALVAAVTAMVGREGLGSIPETAEFDSRGLRMEMVYCGRDIGPAH
jgi:predicted RNase H-like nuclease